MAGLLESVVVADRLGFASRSGWTHSLIEIPLQDELSRV